MSDEAKLPTSLDIPEPPSQQERELHELTHLPYRNWCKVCVRARGLPDHHKKQKMSELPIVQIEYAFVTSVETKEMTTLLTAVDVTTGMYMAIVVNTQR